MAVPWQLVCGVVSSIALHCGCGPEQRAAPRGAQAIPVETAEVARGRIEEARVFTGTLDAFTELAYAAKITGRIKSVGVDLGDVVGEGSVLVTLEDDEHRQAVSLAQADVTIANAQQLEVQSTLETAQRELARVEKLHAQGLMSEAAVMSQNSIEQMRRDLVLLRPRS